MSDICNNHQPIDKNKQISICKFCYSIIQLNSTCSTVISSSLKPSELKNSVEINPIDTFRLIQAQAKVINIKAPYFIDYCNIRTDSIKALRGLVRRYFTGEEVFGLALFLIDMILSTRNHKINNEGKSSLMSINPNNVTSACFLLALKFLDINYCLSEVINDIIEEDKEIIEYEQICLSIIDYKLNWYTPFSILELILSCGIFFENELFPNTKNTSSKGPITITVMDKIESAHQLCYNILNFLISDLKSLEFKSEYIVFSIVTIVREHFKVKQKWHQNLIKFYSVKFEDFEECYNTMNKLYTKNTNTSIEAAISHYKIQIKEENKLKDSLDIKAISAKVLSKNTKFAELYNKSNSLDKSIFKKTSIFSNKTKTKNKIRDHSDSSNPENTYDNKITHNLSIIKEARMHEAMDLSQDSFYSKSFFGLEDNSLHNEISTNISSNISQSTSSSALHNSILVLSKKSSFAKLEEDAKMTRNSRGLLNTNNPEMTVKVHPNMTHTMNRIYSSSLGRQINISSNFTKSKGSVVQQLSKNKMSVKLNKQISFNSNKSSNHIIKSNCVAEKDSNTRQLVDQTIKKYSNTKIPK